MLSEINLKFVITVTKLYDIANFLLTTNFKNLF